MKKLLVIPPLLPDWNEVNELDKHLKFLKSQYRITYVDPLSGVMPYHSPEQYFELWTKKWPHIAKGYDAYLGFSLGGLLLKMAVLHGHVTDKPVIFVSTPFRMEHRLREQLSTVLTLLAERSLPAALAHLRKLVHTEPVSNDVCSNEGVALSMRWRLAQGVRSVLSYPYAQKMPMHHLQLLGAESRLVTAAHAERSAQGRVVLIPGAGMRVLQEAPETSAAVILHYLQHFQLQAGNDSSYHESKEGKNETVKDSSIAG